MSMDVKKMWKILAFWVGLYGATTAGVLSFFSSKTFWRQVEFPPQFSETFSKHLNFPMARVEETRDDEKLLKMISTLDEEKEK